MSKSLIYMRSSYIVEFCVEHPVDQCRGLEDYVGIGGPGDIKSPVPVAESFLRWITDRQAMLTQKDLWDYVASEPDNHKWLRDLTRLQALSFEARVYRNFYSTLIDSLHVWALCIENMDEGFDKCILDSTEDATAKTDLTLYRGDFCVRLALRVDTQRARKAAEYKRKYRGLAPFETLEVLLKINGKTLMGGKHWYTWPDIRNVLYPQDQDGLFGNL